MESRTSAGIRKGPSRTSTWGTAARRGAVQLHLRARDARGVGRLLQEGQGFGRQRTPAAGCVTRRSIAAWGRPSASSSRARRVMRSPVRVQQHGPTEIPARLDVASRRARHWPTAS